MIRVLVADDDQKLLRMLRRTLTYECFDVVTASDGQQALEAVKAHHPEVIILDWMMPGLDGIQVTERLRAENDPTPILMLTARDAIEDRVEGLDSGADDYLVKPFAPVELVARLHALLRQYLPNDSFGRFIVTRPFLNSNFFTHSFQEARSSPIRSVRSSPIHPVCRAPTDRGLPAVARAAALRAAWTLPPPPWPPHDSPAAYPDRPTCSVC